jgi:hypothetical protein
MELLNVESGNGRSNVDAPDGCYTDVLSAAAVSI